MGTRFQECSKDRSQERSQERSPERSQERSQERSPERSPERSREYGRFCERCCMLLAVYAIFPQVSVYIAVLTCVAMVFSPIQHILEAF